MLLSQRGEFAVVVAVAFGSFILTSLLAVFAPAPASQVGFTDGALGWLIVQEVTVGALLAAWLWSRGWRSDALGLGFAGRDIQAAGLLALAAFAAYWAVEQLGELALPGSSAAWSGLTAGRVGPVAAIATSVVNPVFEELFVCAYVIRALQRTRSTAFAVNASVGIRVAYHLYQGPYGAISIIPLGLLFGWWFARTGRLWPVVVAHGVLDLVGLLALDGT